MSTAIAFENVSKTFTVNGRAFAALDDVSLAIDRGDIYGIVGYSGAGKSTLLRTVNALERPTSGRVLIDGRDVTALNDRELSRQRQRIGMIFQQFNLLGSRNVYKNIAYPLKLAGLPPAEIVDRVEELLDFVGLTDKALQYPNRLSGGQKQRVGIARALANRPDILISDEATSALDPQTTGEVLDLLQRVNREYGVTILLVTHEMDVIRRIADKVAVMEDGRVVEHGSVYDVFSNPQNDTTRRFVGSVLDHEAADTTLGRIREVHTGRLVRIHVGNRETNDPFLSRIARRHEVDFNVVYGGVSELQSRLFGTLTVELLGAGERVDAAVTELRELAEVVELSAAGEADPAAAPAPAADAPNEEAALARH
ncbi:methionine ABC transporter ATP-binding protein [Microbacterium stercoris]|uniref:ATP-binding cassette domain-containing protein n=1 Tax=Microbacterium stercoris TaxID=2820289 RepID=A0A939QIC0_9MICO|nr:ATP-binding cassette domain-containing protein [Microbacterium stercoris]MBO3663454.1 ATP-binding cassette domain-containing protein [Microbacterium stercoris]